MSQRTVLIVEDDLKIADMTANYLRMHAFTSLIVADGLAALAQVRSSHPPALMLLDLMLPGLDGVEVCRSVRQFSALPIIMVTARVDEIDRLLGLDVGADDYVCKPFSPRELVARVKALLRRSDGTLGKSPALLELQLHSERQQVLWQGHALPLTPVEYRLLALFLTRPGHVFARAKLLDHLHQDFRDVGDRAIDSHVKNIRRKLEQVGALHVGISSVYGVGYRFDAV